MKINIKNFKNVLNKATMNFGIETLQLRFGDRIKSDMLSGDGVSIAILNLENDVFDSNEELVLNFGEPNANVIPFVSLFDNNEVDFSMNDNFMVLKDGLQSTKILTCSENAVRRLGTDDVVNDNWFYETKIETELMEQFDKIKKIGSRFGKVYFIVENNKLYIETSDRTNMYSNGVKFKIADGIESDNLSLVYPYGNMVNFFHCINVEKDFTMMFKYDNEQELGCIYAVSEDSSEKYSLISRKF